jgi:hypothetical protein
VRRRRTVPALLLVIFLFVTLGTLTGAQATGATVGPRLLGRLAAALFELDRWTPQHQEELQTVAQERTRGQVEVNGLPVHAAVSPAAVLGNADSLANSIAAAAGEELYTYGRVAFVDGEGAQGDISITKPVRWAIALLEQEEHQSWQVALAVSAGLTLAAFVLVAVTSWSGLAGAVRTVTVGSAIFTLVSTLIWVVCQIASHAILSAPDSEVARMLGDCARLGLQDGVTVGVAGVLLNLVLRQLAQQGSHYEKWPAALDEPA